MKKTLACIMLPMAVLLMSGYVVAQEQSQGDQTSGAEGELTVGVPDLADIIPLASELSGRLATLENTIGSGLDTSAVEKKYDTIEANLKDPAGQLQRLRDSKDYKHNKLVKLRKTIKKEEELLEEISKPLSDAIRQLGTRRTEWLTEKKLWSEWQSSLQKEGELDQLKSTFENANRTIDAALALILPRLEAMLTVQQKGGNIQERIYALAAELDALTAEELRDVLLDVSPPMFSSQYLSQFTSGLWYAVKRGMDEISWPDSRFFARQGWIVLLQGFVSLFVIIAVYRNRRVLNESKRWRFLAARPFSAGLFLTSMTTALFYEYGGAPAIWILANVTVAGTSFAR
ncbi:MAG: hypothetical protein ACYSR6_06630, partial [Planctomycetota bacterium]